MESLASQLKREHQAWQRQIPPHLKNVHSSNPELAVQSQWIKYVDLEFQFLLHHPVVLKTPNSPFSSDNLQTTLEICDGVLQTAQGLSQYNALDTQWVSLAFLLAVIMTTLWIYEHLQQDMTLEKLKKLQDDMLKWDKVLQYVALATGAGDKLQQATMAIVYSSIDGHTKFLESRDTAAAAAAQQALLQTESQSMASDQRPQYASYNLSVQDQLTPDAKSTPQGFDQHSLSPNNNPNQQQQQQQTQQHTGKEA